MKKPVGWKALRGRTLWGQPGRIVRPPYTTDNLRAPGEPPESIQLDTTLFDAMAERRRSPKPPKKMARKGTRRTVLQNDTELENWLNFHLHLKKSEQGACEEARQNGQESFHVTL